MPKSTNINPVNFLTEVKTELKKVTWPTRKEAVKMTALVITISIVVGTFIGLLDYIFTLLVQKIV